MTDVPSALGAAEAPASQPTLPGLRFAVGASAIALGIAALHFGAALLQPLIVAALLAFVLAPLVRALRRWRLPNGLAVGAVVAGAVAALGLASALMGQQLVQLSSDLPSYQETVRSKLRALRPSTQGSGVFGDALRLLGIVEHELDAARRALSSPGPRPVQRVQVEPAPPQPLQALAQLAGSALVPLAQIGLTLVLLVGMLLQRHEMRDRLLCLLGNELHPMADALNEAGRRVSRYLLAQVLVNLAYGLPLGLGLWLLGVPGAWAWGLLGALLRFVPYLGPVVAAAIPLLLAFAVDPGWSLVLQTALLIGGLELLLNNLVEPLAYGSSTGVSPLAVLLSAGFWGLVWGPVGLVLATPITVCLLVLGRHLGPLRLLDQLLSNKPVFDPPTRLHQRLVGGEVEEALQLGHEQVARAGLASVYDELALPALALATTADSSMTAAHRHRLVSGMAQLLQGLREEHPPAQGEAPALLLCLAARSEFDALSAEMLADLLQHEGLAARCLPASALSAERIAELPLQGVAAVILCSFSAAPATHARYVARRLQRLRPGLPLLLGAWAAADPAEAVDPGWTLATSLQEALRRLQVLAGDWPRAEPGVETPASAPQAVQTLLARSAQRLVDVFGSAAASALLLQEHGSALAHAGLPSLRLRNADALLADGAPLRAVLDQADPLVVPDLARDAQFGGHESLRTEGLQFFAAVPLAAAGQAPLGLLLLQDLNPRTFGDEDLRLLQRMAAELATALQGLDREAAALSALSYAASACLPAATGGGAA